jgi:hypothetical protein
MYSDSANKLADFICSLPNLNRQPTERSTYGHMGATLTDAILQPGLNYRTVVYPRVQSVIARFPDATSTTAFWAVLETYTPANVLNWSHPEKLRRLLEFASLLLELQVQTEADLRRWVLAPGHAEILLSIKGVGPKTLDYVKLLTGVPTVAVDRHIRKFVAMAGIQIDDYDEIRCVVLESAEILELDPSTLDHSIWHYLSR